MYVSHILKFTINIAYMRISKARFSQVIKMDKHNMIKMIKTCIPSLDGKSHKGEAGRIGVIGGSLEYTGAPYFAGLSALKVGADLAHIFCTSQAAIVIKSYSPELIVHPLLDHPKAVSEITPWFDRLHAIVIGPGLGRDSNIFEVVSELIEIIKHKQIPLVIDADGLFLVNQKVDLIKGFSSNVILTPNSIEFVRLCDAVGGQLALKEFDRNVIILKKGSTDEVICDINYAEWKMDEGGSGRRCGGQGDLLSGSIASFLHWTTSNAEKLNTLAGDRIIVTSSLSCYAASLLVRKCNEKAFKKHGRSMLASDMLQFINESFQELFGE